MIMVACDHAAVELKTEIVAWLEAEGLTVEDAGTHGNESVDYPDMAHLVARAVAEGRADRGVLVCGSGLGMSIAANRHPGVRAALCHDAFTAEMARRHNDANVLCLGARVTGPGVALQAVQVFVDTPFDGGRHQRRVIKIEVSPEES